MISMAAIRRYREAMSAPGHWRKVPACRDHVPFARASGHWSRCRPDYARRFITSEPLLPKGAISRSQRTDALIVVIVTTVVDNLEIWCLGLASGLQ